MKIKAVEKNLPHKARVKCSLKGNFIWIDKKVKETYSEDALIGLFAHELGHFLIFEKNQWGCIRVNLDFIVYRLFKKYARKVEQEADKIAIDRGYERELKLNYSAVKPKWNTY